MMRQIYGLFMKRDYVNELIHRIDWANKVHVSEKENHLPIDSLHLGIVVVSELAKLGVAAETNKLAI